MPVKTVSRRHRRAPRHKQTKNYLQTYWPYLPMLLIVIIGLILGGPKSLRHSQHDVLAYATEMSVGGLLSATNAQRGNNGQAALSLNQKLNNAAQAKANDMIARNYWSHNTPDGQPPWTFMQNAGYTYTKAGENLAYGFATSNDTITGWMNSPSHKANLLDSGFSEVGFGFANGSDYNQSGQETVVVAMYGHPQVLASSTQAAAAPTTPKVAAKPSSSPAPQPTPARVTDTKPASPAPTETKKDTAEAPKTAVEPASTTVSRGQLLTGGRTPWAIAALSTLSGLGVLLLLLRHGWGFRRLLHSGEHFVMAHPLIDTLLVAIIMVGYVLSTTRGIIR